MAHNKSTQSNGAPFSIRKLSDRVIVVQVLIAFFLYINGLLLTGFFKKEVFRRSMRYILFAYTLISDSLYLSLTNVLLILAFFDIVIRVHICLLILSLLSVYTFVFPLTLTAMTLERYVAICMPMQHAALSTQRNALHFILIITSISSLPITISLSTYWASLPHGISVENGKCSIEMLFINRWQNYLISAVNQIYFLIMVVIVVLCYVQITKAARKASGETKKSFGKGLRTVILHGLQLILCFTRFWCPFVEAVVLQIDLMLFINVRYANYIMFIIAPRCLSSLIYGIRDRKLSVMLKYYAVCGLFYKRPPVLSG